MVLFHITDISFIMFETLSFLLEQKKEVQSKLELNKNSIIFQFIGTKGANFS